MGRFLDAVSKGLEELTKPESFRAGEAFEKYVRDHLFPDADYELIYQTSSYAANKERYATASMKPDFLFRDRRTKKKFYVECKYRADEYRKDDKLEWTNPEQLKRYREAATEYPVFIALGTQGVPKDPEFIFLMPLSQTPYCGLYDSFLRKYLFWQRTEISSFSDLFNEDFSGAVSSSYLWELECGR